MFDCDDLFTNGISILGTVFLLLITKCCMVSAPPDVILLKIISLSQPAAEIIGFRMGELRGLSRWRTRFHGIGLDETLINNATEKSGMLLVQVERFMRVLSSVVQQVNLNI